MNNQVGDAPQTEINQYSRNTYNSLRPLNWLLSLFAINSNVEDKTYSKAFYILKCLLAFTVLGSLDIYSLYYKNKYFYNNVTITQSVQLTDTVQMVYDFIQYIVDLWFVYKYGRHISLEYFKQYEYIDTILDMTDYSKIKWKLIRLLSVFSLIWVLTSTCDFMAWSFSYGWTIPMVYSVAYIFLYIKMLTTLDLSSHVMHIKFRLMTIADIVQNYYILTESLPGFLGSYISNNNWLYEKDCWQNMESKAQAKAMKLQPSDKCLKIRLLTRCYLQLTEQVNFINSIFGFRILLNSLSLLIDIIRFTNISVKIILGTQIMPNESRYIPAVSSMMRQMACVLLLFSLVTQCEEAYYQRDRIISTIDHLLLNKNPSDKLRAAVTELRGIIQARPISFNLANFFRLDNSFLVSITSVVVTYTIILLQTLN